jgi:threonine aldolase
MAKHSFKNDYSEGCHPNILKALSETNFSQQAGYGEDEYSLEAARLIREKIENPEAAVHFVSGGTQANLTVISSALRSHECVIAATTGHINVHETGAIEATGHKVETVDTADGKLSPKNILTVLAKCTDEHIVRPRMVYISNSTEIGTHYSLPELKALSACCREHNLYLFMDGARLASALCAEDNDITMPHLAKYTDVFYIGGTKNGALLGEAIVINNPALNQDFRYHLKQRGALMAKGRLLGVQFLELFKENLFFELAQHANHLAGKMADAFTEAGYPLLTISYTNQIFPILPYEVIEKLQERFDFYIWQKLNDKEAAIRLVTSWATPEEAVNELISTVKGMDKPINI